MPGSELAGTKVLITRPAQQAQGLIELIRQAGGEPIECPALMIEALTPTPELLATLSQLGRYHLLIFISPNAVEHLAQRLRGQGAMLPAEARLACVGAGTTRRLAEVFGRQPDVQAATPYDSEALLAAPAMFEVAGKRLLIVRGEGGRELLADTLRQRGAVVEYAEVYRRVCPTLSPAQQSTISHAQVDVITVTSGESLRNLLAMFQPKAEWLLDTPVIVINQRLVELVRQLGFKWEAVAATEASDRAMLEAIIQWRRAARG